MCGIAAKVEFKPDSGTSVRLGKGLGLAIERMRERGPDGNGVHVRGNWGLGHTRLAIVDLAAGAQPWLHEESSCALSYNGEIFNYLAINAELKAKGHTFKTHCDTETVMESYLEWGESCVDRFNGFFAFALIDPRSNKLFAARDRLGVKPLHYRLASDGLSLASSVAATALCAGARIEPDIAALSHFLTTGRVSFGRDTLAKGVSALPPGHCMSVDLTTGETRIRRYWERPILSPEEKLEAAPPFEKAAEMTAGLLDDAVGIRLMGDVPLGSFLSGGIDSSIIALCASRHLNGMRIPLFCAGSDDERMNEYEYADMMASHLGLSVERVQLDSSGFMRDWGMLCERKGLPLSTPNEVSIHHLSKALGRQCKIALTGEGADELFGGYTQAQFSAFDLERSLKGPEGSFECSPLGMGLTLLYGRCRFLNDTDHFLSTACWMPYSAKAELFKPEHWEAIEEDSPVFLLYEDFFERHAKCSAFDRRMHLFAEFNLESLLHRIDNSSMTASIEARVPFTDYRLAELAFRMPDSYKIDFAKPSLAAAARDLSSAEIVKRGMLEDKRLPRHAFASSLPRQIVERPKKSFPVPVAKWLKGDLFQEVKAMCLESPLAKDVFRRDVLERRLDHGGEDLWALANACKWSYGSG